MTTQVGDPGKTCYANNNYKQTMAELTRQALPKVMAQYSKAHIAKHKSSLEK